MVLACGNCGGESAKTDRYVPAPEISRAAVEAVLADWKDGLAAGSIDRLAVMVNVVDQHRKPGQALAAFEILGETPSAAGRCLVVRLKYDQPEGEETARYVVIGIDPLWVFRQEDFELMNQWDHPMPAETPVQAESETGERENPADEQQESERIKSATDDRILEGDDGDNDDGDNDDGDVVR
jgi:hypothetical protein